jgi:hypothetical protein
MSDEFIAAYPTTGNAELAARGSGVRCIVARPFI